MKIEDRSVRNSGVIRGNVTTGDTAQPAPAAAPAEEKKTRLTPQVVAALIAAAAAIVVAIIGFLKH